jgi:hypothetical protein
MLSHPLHHSVALPGANSVVASTPHKASVFNILLYLICQFDSAQLATEMFLLSHISKIMGKHILKGDGVSQTSF